MPEMLPYDFTIDIHAATIRVPQGLLHVAGENNRTLCGLPIRRTWGRSVGAHGVGRRTTCRKCAEAALRAGNAVNVGLREK